MYILKQFIKPEVKPEVRPEVKSEVKPEVELKRAYHWDFEQIQDPRQWLAPDPEHCKLYQFRLHFSRCSISNLDDLATSQLTTCE